MYLSVNYNKASSCFSFVSYEVHDYLCVIGWKGEGVGVEVWVVLRLFFIPGPLKILIQICFSTCTSLNLKRNKSVLMLMLVEWNTSELEFENGIVIL